MDTNANRNDPYDNAENPSQPSYEHWGEVAVECYFCVLEKGIGKMPYDEAVHSFDQRRTGIKIGLYQILEQNARYPVEREMIAESREWAKIVLPSIKSLGVSLRDLNGKYAKIVVAPTGETYTNKSGEVKERTTVKFLKLFNTQEECAADYLSGNGTHYSEPEGDRIPTVEEIEDNNEKQAALAFLKVIVQNAARGQTDPAVILKTVEANLPDFPLVSKHYTIDNPDVLRLVQESAEAPF